MALTQQVEESLDEASAQESAKMILDAVEEFQQKRAKLTQWRASD